jgi:hypothetical protein
MDRLFGSRQAGGLAVAMRLAAVLGALGAIGAGAGWGAALSADASQTPQTFGITLPQHVDKALKPVRLTPSERAGIALGAVPEVRLQAIDRDAILKEDAMNERTGQAKLLRFAVARDIKLATASGNWYDLSGGARLWVGDVVSSEALGIRLHFTNVHLPAGAEVAVYAVLDPSGAGGTLRNGFPAFDPQRSLEIYQGSEAQAGRSDFWTGTQSGERVRIEYLAPAGAGADLPFAVDSLQHLYLDPVAKLAKSLIQQKDAGACENDVTCFPEWADQAKSVAGLGIIVSGGSAFCTGQLINDQAGDFTPYFLTAHHCLSSQQDAGNSEFFWFYQTDICNGTPPSIDSVPRSQGGTLVSTGASSDFTLLMVEGALPDGLFWSGWTATPVANGTDAVGIHHPEADFKRISFGFKDESSACPANFDRVSWTSGVTEPGSSGSGIFRVDSHQLFGQLFGGPSACGADPGSLFDCYGAFAVSYPRIKNPLRKGWDDTSEPNNTCAQARVVATGTLKNRVVKILAPDWYKIRVRPGRTLTVRVNFVNANGDIDLDLFAADCGSDPLVTSRTTDDQEIVTWTNNTGQPAFFTWKVYLASDTRNYYSMTVSIR